MQVILLALVLLELSLYFHSAWWPGKLPSCRDKDLQHSPTHCTPCPPYRETISANREKWHLSGWSLFSAPHAKTTPWRGKMLKKDNKHFHHPWTWCFYPEETSKAMSSIHRNIFDVCKGIKSLLSAQQDSGFGFFCYKCLPSSVQFISLMISHL